MRFHSGDRATVSGRPRVSAAAVSPSDIRSTTMPVVSGSSSRIAGDRGVGKARPAGHTVQEQHVGGHHPPVVVGWPDGSLSCRGRRQPAVLWLGGQSPWIRREVADLAHTGEGGRHGTHRARLLGAPQGARPQVPAGPDEREQVQLGVRQRGALEGIWAAGIVVGAVAALGHDPVTCVGECRTARQPSTRQGLVGQLQTAPEGWMKLRPRLLELAGRLGRHGVMVDHGVLSPAAPWSPLGLLPGQGLQVSDTTTLGPQTSWHPQRRVGPLAGCAHYVGPAPRRCRSWRAITTRKT
jgi:hypothetical protein